MQIVKSDFTYKIYANLEEMSSADKEIVLKAVDQLEHAYAPYSKFHVGAALRLVNGEIFIGSNQENASYPLCMCGERVALYNAGANRPDIAVESLAITIKNQHFSIDKPVSPCGACRQVIAEYEFRHKHPIRILLKSDGESIYELSSIKELLPLGFDGSFL